MKNALGKGEPVDLPLPPMTEVLPQLHVATFPRHALDTFKSQNSHLFAFVLVEGSVGQVGAFIVLRLFSKLIFIPADDVAVVVSSNQHQNPALAVLLAFLEYLPNVLDGRLLPIFS